MARTLVRGDLAERSDRHDKCLTSKDARGLRQHGGPSRVALDNAPRITCPVIYIRGDQEEGELYPAERFAQLAGGSGDAEWLNRVLD